MDDQNKFKSFQQQVFQLLEDIGSRLIHKAIDGLSSACWSGENYLLPWTLLTAPTKWETVQEI